MIRVAVADQERLRLQAVALLLAESRDIQIACKFSDFESLASSTSLAETNVLVLDNAIVNDDRDRRLGSIRQQYADLKIVIVLDTASELDIVAYIQAGARAFVLKSDPAERLVSTVRAVASSIVPITPADGRSLVYHWNREESLQSGLTPRERSVLTGLARGRSNREISEVFGLSEKTVKNHVSTILSKLGVHTRTQAAVLAVARGLVPLSDDRGASFA